MTLLRLIFLFIIFTTSETVAQSYDLKFSRVLSVDTTLTCSGWGCEASSADYVVPANSVWKITYFSRSQGTSSCYQPIWTINGTIMDAWPDSNIGNPIIWLESGDTLRCKTVGGSSNCPYRMYFTGVEFILE
jgi:hypothetical protein